MKPREEHSPSERQQREQRGPTPPQTPPRAPGQQPAYEAPSGSQSTEPGQGPPERTGPGPEYSEPQHERQPTRPGTRAENPEQEYVQPVEEEGKGPADQQQSPAGEPEPAYPEVGQQPPHEEQEVDHPPCDDPDAVIRELKQTLKHRQEELQVAQQGSTDLDANIKQLEKLAASIRQAGVKYEQSYDKYAEQECDAACYRKAKSYTVECALSEGARQQIDSIVAEVDNAIKDAHEEVEDKRSELERKQQQYDDAVRALTEKEAKLARWIDAEKWIKELQQKLLDISKKITEAEATCDFCRMYVFVGEYATILHGSDEPGLCDVVKPPDDLLAYLWKLWCAIKEHKDKRADALMCRDRAKRQLDDAIARHAALMASREQTILDRIAQEIPECDEHDDECECESEPAMAAAQ